MRTGGLIGGEERVGTPLSILHVSETDRNSDRGDAGFLASIRAGSEPLAAAPGPERFGDLGGSGMGRAGGPIRRRGELSHPDSGHEVLPSEAN